MKSGLYLKLSVNGIKKNKKLYLPYLITCICMVMMFYLIDYLAVSPQFAQIFQRAAVQGDAAVTFFIGSSYGLADSVKQAANLRLSMSAMTFPHQLARVMLLEQIYRSYQILSGTKYHK